MWTQTQFHCKLFRLCLLLGVFLLIGLDSSAQETTSFSATPYPYPNSSTEPGYPWEASDYQTHTASTQNPTNLNEQYSYGGATPSYQITYTPQEEMFARWDSSLRACVPGWGRELPRTDEAWSWQWLPLGILYRSYFASNRESRIGAEIIHESKEDFNYWDPTLGGRFGIVRYGNTNRLYPEGFQIDLECAVLARLTVDHKRDVWGSDYRVGIPLTYRSGNFEWKFGYYHISSHMGDEWMVEHYEETGELYRINYVRDCIMFGMAYRPDANWRFFVGGDFAAGTDGGAKPWIFELGCEYSPMMLPNFAGSPFLALYLRWKEENDYDTYVAFETGWQWKTLYQSTFRGGLYLMSGDADQYQFYNRRENQVGFGVWYDF